MFYKKLMAYICTLFVATSAFAYGEDFAYLLIEKYANKVIVGENEFAVLRVKSPTGLVVGAAYTKGFRANDTCCSPRTKYGTERAGVITVYNFSGGNHDLIQASNVFRLPSKTSGSPGAYVSEVVIGKPDKFTVRIECDQCVGLTGDTNVRFHFAFRNGRWVVAGMDRESSKIVGELPINPQTQQKSIVSGVVERVSHNYRTGQRIVKTYSFDEAKARMKLVSNISTQGMPLQIPLDAFDPASEILGYSR